VQQVSKLNLEQRGIRVKDADNEVSDGIRMTSTMIAQRKIKAVKDKCKRTIGDITSYIWDEKAAERGEEKPVKTNDHACITSDTLIDTTEGRIPIKDLIGHEGRLYCYDELKKTATTSEYYNVCKTKENADIFELELEDGRKIKATSDHPILTPRGWIQLKDLTTEDCIIDIHDQL
jgi:hypothetical protein